MRFWSRLIFSCTGLVLSGCLAHAQLPAIVDCATHLTNSESSLQPSLPHGPLRHRLVISPRYLNASQFPEVADRVVLQLSGREGVDLSLLSPEGRKTYVQLMDSVDPVGIMRSLAERFNVSERDAQAMLFVDGELWIRRMFAARDQGDWAEVIRIYDQVLSGPWQKVTEATLQAALALNRRRQSGDRERALGLVDDVIKRIAGQSLASEAYGIRARIFKDDFRFSKNPADRDEAIKTYLTGFDANPLDQYPGSAALGMMLGHVPLKSEAMQRLLRRLDAAVTLNLQRFRDQGREPDVWALGTAFQLDVLYERWASAAAKIPSLFVLSGGPQNVESHLETLERIKQIWAREAGDGASEKVRRVDSLINLFRRAQGTLTNRFPLTRHSPSYVSHQEFPNMEGAFGTQPVNVWREVEASGIQAEIFQLGRSVPIKIASIHRRLTQKVSRGILLAPTGPYEAVIRKIAEQIGATYWGDAYQILGLDLNPANSEEFIKRALLRGFSLHLLVPQNFLTQHRGSHTLAEYQILKGLLPKHFGQIEFVFGFEQVFPLDYRKRLSQTQADAVTDRVMGAFTKRFQSWLTGLGAQVREYEISDQFSASLYPLVYDQTLRKLSFHQELRQLHSQWLSKGTAERSALILDAGGGTGLVAEHLRQQSRWRSVEVFDQSRAMLNFASEKELLGPTRVHVSKVTELVRQNGRRVPDQSVDGVVSNNVAYLLTRQQIAEFFGESFRVLRQGGRLSLASMAFVNSDVHEAFLSTAKREVLELEKSGQVPEGSAELMWSSNQQLVDQAPTLLSEKEVDALASAAGLRRISGWQRVYGGAGFFAVYEKP